MRVTINIHYNTYYRQIIGINYALDKGPKVFLPLQTHDSKQWQASLEFGKNVFQMEYNYLVEEQGTQLQEWGKPRVINLSQGQDLEVIDFWRARDDKVNIFLSSAFTEAIFRRSDKRIKKRKSIENGRLKFELTSALIQSNLVFGVVGNTKELGNWENPIQMDENCFPIWRAHVDTKNIGLVEYKYVLVDPKTNQIVHWEEGDNRCIYLNGMSNILVRDDHFRYKNSQWRGTGVAIPVFSIRSTQGMGIGEFGDIGHLVDWSYQVGMQFIQVLPVNDTIAQKTWVDSYPYAGISVHALHPLYVSIHDIAKFDNQEDEEAYINDRARLNEKEQIDFEDVLTTKFKYFHKIYNQEGARFYKSIESKKFLEEQKDWIYDYAAFCYLRDSFGTVNFNNWKGYKQHTSALIREMKQDNEIFAKMKFYIFIQYHAYKQLIRVRDYARKYKIVLKGDLPIGIYRYSCDAWVSPELFYMQEQAGAPPDDYAEQGQNWGFPTYNWEEMSKDGFLWWSKRMKSLNQFFDAIRIDHILGFFRIWQIPIEHTYGTLGLFNPRLPFTKEELTSFGIYPEIEYSKPYITEQEAEEKFGHEKNDILAIFFEKDIKNIYFLCSDFDTQKKIKNFIAQNPKFAHFEHKLLDIIADVLLIAENIDGETKYNPRISLQKTEKYQKLDPHTKDAFLRLHNAYFYQRHNAYWKQQAIWKLPPIIDASDMMICGEDLGMIPKSVPEVMDQLNILTLEIQRMPKGDESFGNVKGYPYFSVCSPSCHDMSTIRGWWESNHEMAKQFYYNYLHHEGLTPQICTEEIVATILEDHLASPSMLAIFPIQDLLGIDETLRNPNALAEQINEPSNPKHYWRFRLHLTIEELLLASSLNNKIKALVKKYR